MSTTAPSPVYDVFLSYRHGDPDQALARQLLRDLEAAGYKVAIDVRDFDPARPVRDEMQRCTIESRFTVGVITSRYLESGFIDFETVVKQTLDMTKRQHSYIPAKFEAGIHLPLWMFALAGVDFAEVDPLVPPLDRLKKALGDPL
jgi:hypothetical protein